jgi:hypothetical protein
LLKWPLILFCLFSSEAFSFEGRLLVESVTQSIDELRDHGVPSRSCIIAIDHNLDRPFCTPAVLEAASIHYNFQSQNYPTSDAAMRSLLRQQNLAIRGRLFGRSIRADYDQGRMVAEVQQGDDLQFNFTPRPGFYSLDRVSKGSEGECTIQECTSVDEKVARTMEMMRRLHPEQREAWVRFCEEHPEYERNARSMRDTNWRRVVDDRDEHYRGCAPDLNWKRVSAWGLCGGGGTGGFPLYSPEVFENFSEGLFPKVINFHFDGYGDFNPRLARLNGAVNLTGDERGEDVFDSRNANGLYFYRRVTSNLMFEDQDFNMSHIQFNYQDGANTTTFTGSASAAACYEDMQRWLDAIGPLIPGFMRPKTMALGYSNGGAAALNFQREISRRGRSLDLLVTLDPIPRPARFVMRTILPSDLLTARHPNTRRHVNFYQDIDFGSMPGLRLRSSPVSSADINYELTPHSWGGHDGHQAHLRLLNSHPVQFNVMCEMQALLNPQSDLCY